MGKKSKPTTGLARNLRFIVHKRTGFGSRNLPSRVPTRIFLGEKIFVGAPQRQLITPKN